MKKLYIILAAVAATFAVSSCDLSEYNPNEPSPAVVFSDEASIKQVCNDFYDSFPSLTEAYSQDGAGSVDYLIAPSAMNGRYQQNYTPEQAGEWSGWGKLRKYNYFLEMLQSDVCQLKGATLDNYIGIGKLFRAYWYFGKLKSYGDLPWYGNVIMADDIDNQYKDRESREVIIDNIITDLDDAFSKITRTSPDKTTPDKWVAAFLKMQACLYEASFRKYNNVTTSVKGEAFKHDANYYYELAAKAAEVIINSKQFALAPDYRSLFTQTELNTSEVILGVATGSSSSFMGSQNNYFNAPGAQKTMVRAFVNTYLNADGTTYTSKSSYQTDSFVQEFTGRDPRLSATLRYPGYKYDGKDVVSVPDIVGSAAPLGYQPIKFCLDRVLDDNRDQEGNHNTNSTPIYRYAEVLLSYAEAKAELGQMDDAIWASTIGELRKRAGITGASLSTVPKDVDSYIKETFYRGIDNAAILEIRRERGVELALEGRRTDDIIRWGCGSLLANLPWDGINISGMDTLIDVDGNGKPDYFFTAKPLAEVAPENQPYYVQVNAANGLKVVANGAVYKLTYEIGAANRYWYPDNRQNLSAISSITIGEYHSKGYTLTQNPGY